VKKKKTTGKMKSRALKILFSSIVLLSLCACEPDKGEPIIKEDEMANLLADYYVIQAAVSLYGVEHDEAACFYYQKLMEDYGYTEAEFDSSMVWYSQNMDVLETVYNRANEKLKHKRDSLERLASQQK
jgi:hypothetical protein